MQMQAGELIVSAMLLSTCWGCQGKRFGDACSRTLPVRAVKTFFLAGRYQQQWCCVRVVGMQ